MSIEIGEKELSSIEGGYFDSNVSEKGLKCAQDVFSQMSNASETIKSDPPSYWQQIKYETSLAYTKYGAMDMWWTKIEPFNLYLGALPLKNEGHLEKISELGVTDVLSLVESFEMKDGWVNTPVKGQDWEGKGISFKQIQAADFLPLKQEEIEEGAQHLNTLLQQGRTIYVHCKAGRGRSASIVIVYLMKFQGFSFDKAFELVKEQRPQINLNDQQRGAILEYFAKESKEVPLINQNPSLTEKMYSVFQNTTYMSEDGLVELLDHMLYYVINGKSYSPEKVMPEMLSSWIPSLDVESTLERRDQYLRQYEGNQVAATEAAIKDSRSLTRQFISLAANAIPFIGGPTNHSIALWYQLREIALIAAIHGHDLNDPKVKMNILSCLVGGNLLKAPAETVDFIARKVIKKMIGQMGISTLGMGIPAHLIFNYFTDNAAKVSAHAKLVFAGENSILIPPEEV